MGKTDGQVTVEPIDVSRTWSEIIKVTEKQCVWNWMECFAKIEINGVNLTLGMN
jgi:hypothetical protein